MQCQIITSKCPIESWLVYHLVQPKARITTKQCALPPILPGAIVRLSLGKLGKPGNNFSPTKMNFSCYMMYRTTSQKLKSMKWTENCKNLLYTAKGLPAHSDLDMMKSRNDSRKPANRL